MQRTEAGAEMSAKIYDILICCKTDLKHLVQVKKYLENSAKEKTTNILTVETIKIISTIVSAIDSLHHPKSEYMEIIIDTLLFAVRNKNNESGRIESECGNLTLKILQCIEHDAKFHILLCKLLSLINLMCSHSINVWQLLARPVLNVFVNKKFKHAYMEKALREFTNISKNSKLSDLVRAIKQNQDITKLFSMLVRVYGDFLVQMNILELLVLLKRYDKSIVKTVFGCWSRETRELLDYLTFSNFRKDSRVFLNAFNRSLGLGKKVFSLKCRTFYFGNSKLSPLPGLEGIWIDLNKDSKRICIFCTGFLLNPKADYSDVLQIPVKEVERVKLKFYTISGEDCYCIYMKIRNASETDHFKVGSGVICKALVSVNQRNEVVDFVKAIEEISEKNLRYWKMKTNEIPSSNDSLSQNSSAGQLKAPMGESINNYNVNILVTSPLPPGSDQKNANKQSLSLSQTSYASSAFSVEKDLMSEENCDANSNVKTCGNLFHEKRNNLEKGLEDPNLEVNQISSSVLESQILPLDSSLNSSVSAHTPAIKMLMSGKWVVSNDIQLDISRSEVGIRNELFPNTQDASGTSNYKDMMIDGNSDNTKNYEESNQIKRTYSCRMYEECANSLNNSTSADELRLKERNKENISETLNVSVLPGKKYDNKTGRLNPMQQNKKLNRKEREKKEEIYRTSLLDPNGYCYKRWKSQTTSERSNFWLNKLKETKTETSQPAIDVFNFSLDEGDYDASNVSKKKTQTAKKTCVSKDKAKNEIQKPGFQMIGEKALQDHGQKTPIEECTFQSKVLVNRGSQAGRTLVNTQAGTVQISVADESADKQDYCFEEFRENSLSKPFSSRYDNLGLKQKTDAEPKSDEKIMTEVDESREIQFADGEIFLSPTNKRKESGEMKEVCDLKLKYLKSVKACPHFLKKHENAKRKYLRSISYEPFSR